MPMRSVVRHPEAVIFDLDGTLIDTAAEFVLVVQQLRRAHGLPPLPESTVHKSISGGSAAMVAAALGSEPGHPDHEDLRSEFLRLYEQVLGSAARPYPGLHSLIKQLADAGIAWGVVTNKFRRFAEPLIERMDFRPVIGSLVTPCDVAQPKPHPESILLACKQLEAEPRRSIYVGDHQRDIDAGRAAGCFTIAAAYGYIEKGDNPSRWQADAIAHSSNELANMIMRMTE